MSPAVANWRAALSLLERERELEALAGMLSDAARGAGAAGLVRGPPGIGKTALLAAAVKLARQRGVEVVRASGGEFESGLTFGVARNLFEPALRRASARERETLLAGAAGLARPALEPHIEHAPPARGADPAAAIVHGLYWLCANLAEGGPMLLALDDAHWADEQSLRFIEYLARRVRELGVMLLVAARNGESHPLLEAFAAEPAVKLLSLQPLGIEAVQTLARAATGAQPAPKFSAACLDATGGNPFLLGELLDELVAVGVAPDDRGAAVVPSARSPTVAHALLLRLGRLAAAAERLAVAVAVLGDGAQLRHAAALAQLGEAGAATMIDALATAGVFAPTASPAFAHPMVRESLLGETGAARLATLHAHAAQLLHEDGAAADMVAAHLLAAHPLAAPWCVQTLRAAARGAFARGAPRRAVALLGRALAEPPAPADRGSVLLELGTIEASLFEAEAVDHLRRALELAQVPDERFKARVELGRTLLLSGQVSDALEEFERGRAQAAAENPALAFYLDLEFAGIARFVPATRALAIERLDALSVQQAPDEGSKARLLANLALEALGRQSADRTAALALAALRECRLIEHEGIDSPTIWFAIYALAFCDRFELVDEVLASVFAQAAQSGSGRAFSVACCVRAVVAQRRGELERALASVRRLGEVPGGIVTQPFAIDAQVRALLELGRTTEAARAIADAGLDSEVPDTPFHWPVLSARGRVKIAHGQLRAGVDDALLAGERARAWGSRHPSLLPWRTDAATGLLALGEREQAQRLTDEAVGLARAFGGPCCLGTALCAAGVACGDEQGITLLRQAVGVLAPSPARLEHARALLELGAALRRRGRRADARALLRPAADVAQRCGAGPLAERAHQELLACGARPRRLVLSGVDALTPSERRIAELAARGLANREIAQALFLTVRTVEMHLTGAYRKLGISSRRQLAAALSQSGA